MYSYNSTHKIFTALLIIGVVTALHFMNKAEKESGNYYENGQVKITGEKRNELNHGKYIWYFENGKKMMEGYFEEGHREGLWTQYDMEGNVIMTSNYKNNHLEGELIRYSTNGAIIEQTEYRKDTIYKRVISPKK